MATIYNAEALKLLRSNAQRHDDNKIFKYDVYPRVHHLDDLTEKLYEELAAFDARLGIETLQQTIDAGSTYTGTTTLVSYDHNDTSKRTQFAWNNQYWDIKVSDVGTGANGRVSIQDTSSSFLWSDGTNDKSINFNSADIKVTDTVSSKGVIYAADYSANFVARSLIDKGYADATYQVLGSYLSNISEDTTPQLGGTLDANGNIIDMGVNNITDTTVGNWNTAYGWGDHSIAGYLSNIVSDTTPQLGGSLDVNGQKIVSVANGNIDIEPNGTGNVLLGNMVFDADQTIGAGQDNYVLTYDNAAGVISLEAAAGGGSSVFTNDAADNVFGGTQSGTALTGTSGQRCFFGGYRAGYLVTSGRYNVAIGDRSMSNAATTGDANVAIGSNAARDLTSGFSNVAIGREAGYALATAQHNIMIGHRAGNGVTGNRNICMGYYTGNNAGNDNTMIGVTSGSGSSFGDKNVMLGRTVANLGDGNICIGYNVQQSGNVTGNGNIFIHPSYAGSSTYNAVSGSNNCVIGLDIEVPTGLSNYVSLYDLYRGDHSAGECYMACPSTAAADADLNNSEVHFSVDEAGNNLDIKVKRSDGVVITTALALT